MRNIHLSIRTSVVLTLTLLLLPGLQAARAEDGLSTGLGELAYELRAALGYGMETLAALDVSASSYDAIAAAAISHTHTTSAQLVPQLEAYWSARRARPRACGSDDAFASALSTIQTRKQAIVTANETLAESLRAYLTSQQQAIHDRLADNQGLDPLLALVGGLTEIQCAQLQAACRQRDRILHHPRNWHRQAVRKRAWAAFDATLGQVLTQAQQQELESLEDEVAANAQTAAERERVAMALAAVQAAAEPEDEESSPNQAAVQPPAEPLQTFRRAVHGLIRRFGQARVRMSRHDTLPLLGGPQANTVGQPVGYRAEPVAEPKAIRPLQSG